MGLFLVLILENGLVQPRKKSFFVAAIKIKALQTFAVFASQKCSENKFGIVIHNLFSNDLFQNSRHGNENKFVADQLQCGVMRFYTSSTSCIM